MFKQNTMANNPLKLFLFKGFILILVIACQVANAQKKKKESAVTPTGETIEISTVELRLIMDGYFNVFARTVMEAADSIMRSSNDFKIDNEALFWKMNAIPVAQGSIFSKDPYTAFVDMAVFSCQMKQYFEIGAGKELFGKFQNIAINASEKLWRDLIEIRLSITPSRDISEGIKMVEDFAKQNPITSSYFNRESTLSLMASIQKVEKVRFKTLAEGMAESLDELSVRMNAYTDILPKQIRWQSEYLLNNKLEESQLNRRFDTLTNLLMRVVLLIESSPELVDNQRSLLMQDLKGERSIVLKAIRQERIAVLYEIQKEREIVMRQLGDEITKQREASFQELNSLANQGIKLSITNLQDIVDIIFWRSVILISILVVVLFVGIIWYKKFQ